MMSVWFVETQNSFLHHVYFQITCGWPSAATMLLASGNIFSLWQFGGINSFGGYSIMLLTSDETPLPAKITIDEASWVASLLCIGGLIGNILFGFITKSFGRKMPLCLISIPVLVSIAQTLDEWKWSRIFFNSFNWISRWAGFSCTLLEPKWYLVPLCTICTRHAF